MESRTEKIKLSRVMADVLKEFAMGSYPNEFIGLLRMTNGVLSEILIIPRSMGGRGFAFLDITMIPMLSHSCGTVHSHPSRSNSPSRADLEVFRKMGQYNIIISYPYTDKDIALYDNKGNSLPYIIVQ